MGVGLVLVGQFRRDNVLVEVVLFLSLLDSLFVICLGEFFERRSMVMGPAWCSGIGTSMSIANAFVTWYTSHFGDIAL